jgi:ribosomal protein S8
MISSFCECMRRVGLIQRYESLKNQIKVYLKYDNRGMPMIKTFRHFSKPSSKRHLNVNEIKKLNYGGGYYIVSTSQGWYSSKECLEKNTGGLVACYLGLV